MQRHSLAKHTTAQELVVDIIDVTRPRAISAQ
jgi:hypothetical protein